jgi:hypothetical protein
MVQKPNVATRVLPLLFAIGCHGGASHQDTDAAGSGDAGGGVDAAVVMCSTSAPRVFVSPTGSDAADCLSAGSACATFDRAYRVAAAGDTVQVADGTYPAQTFAAPSKPAGGNVVFQPAPGAAVTLGGLVTGSDYVTLCDLTIDVGTGHGAGGWANTASHVALSEVRLHGLYVTVSVAGASDVVWSGGEVGVAGQTGGKRSCAGGDAEPVQIADSDHVTFEGIAFHPQDADTADSTCGTNGFHLEMLRLDANTAFFTLSRSTFDDGDHSGTSSVFITTPQSGTELPHDLTFMNNFFGTIDGSTGSFDVHSNVTTCQNFTFAYNTLTTGPGALQCATYDNVLYDGNLGWKASFAGCDGTYVRNVWQDELDNTCGSDTWVQGTRYAIDALGLATDHFHLAPGSPAIDAGETAGTCTALLGAIDHDGEPRPAGAACDAGADERH